MMNLLDRALEGLCLIYLRISQVLLAFMVLAVFTEVIMRYFLGSGISGSSELLRLAMTWVVFLMSVVLFRRRRHIVVSALVDVMPPVARRYCEIVINLAVIVLSAYVLLQLYNVLPFITLTTSVFRLPELAFKITPVFAFVPIALQCVINLRRGGGVGGVLDI